MGDLTRNFSRSEFTCKCGCGYDTVDFALITTLQNLRDFFEQPVIVKSGSRCLKHNKYVGGSPKSQHLEGKAADIVVENIPAKVVQEWCIDNGVPGVGQYEDRTHIDVRSYDMARW